MVLLLLSVFCLGNCAVVGAFAFDDAVVVQIV